MNDFDSPQLALLCRRLIEAQEADRRAIGATLHNDVGQALTALKLTLSTPGAADGPSDGNADLAEARQVVSDLLDRVRDMALELRPAMLDDLGLKDTLEWYLERRARPAKLKLDLKTRGLERRPGPDVETACFRVIEEAVANVIRHAGARYLSVHVEFDSKGLEFEIADDGEGFNVEAARARARSGATFGLGAMEGRLMLLGGELVVASAPGQGTRIHGTVPIQSEPPPEGDLR